MNLAYLNKPGYTSQQGVTALLMSLIILTLITMVSLMTARTISVEQKITGNELRSRQAFESAEAGIESAKTYINRVNGGPDRAVSGTVDVNIFTLNGDGETTELAAQVGNVGIDGSRGDPCVGIHAPDLSQQILA